MTTPPPLYVLAPINAPFRPCVCTRCGSSILDTGTAPPSPALDSRSPRQVHDSWHAEIDAALARGQA